MSVIISNIRIGIDDPDELAIEKAKKKLSVKDSRISSIHVYKRSLDARGESILDLSFLFWLSWMETKKGLYSGLMILLLYINPIKRFR